MQREQQPDHTQLTGIHINLEDQAIEFEDQHGTVGRLVFGGETVLYEGRPLLLTPRATTTTTEPPVSPHGPAPAKRPRRPAKTIQNSTLHKPRRGL